MRNVKGKKIYTSLDKSDWNLYKPVQIRGLYKKLMIIVIGLFFLLYFCQSIPLRYYADRAWTKLANQGNCRE